MNLDDIDVLYAIDKSGMLAQMERTHLRLVPSADADSTCGSALKKPLNIVLGGVGGSGIVGDIISDYAKETIDVPVSVCRSLRIPSFVGKQTLFVAISYSGETRETLGLLEQAKQREAMVVAIGSGGKLIARSKEAEIPYLKVTAGLPPRVGLPELLAAAIYVMGSAEMLRDPSKILAEAANSLAVQIDCIKPSVPGDRNSAKQMTQVLLDRLPLLIGIEENASVLRRFKNELNENAKVPAIYFTMPEAYHDDIEGLKALHELASIQPVFLLSQLESKGQQRTRESLRSLIRELGFPEAIHFQGIGQDRLSQLLTAIMFGDYVSVYLAALRGVDPTPLALIPKFRQMMQEASEFRDQG